MKVKVFYHDKCFDGASSAALFSRFYRERIREDADFTFSGLLHRAGALFNESDFDGDENAIGVWHYWGFHRVDRSQEFDRQKVETLAQETGLW